MHDVILKKLGEAQERQLLSAGPSQVKQALLQSVQILEGLISPY